MQFYNLKTRSYVEVPESALKKTKMERKTKNGIQTRYALKADYEGTPLYRFVNEETYNKTDVPQE